MGFKHLTLGKILVTMAALIGSFPGLSSQIVYKILISFADFVTQGALT